MSENFNILLSKCDLLTPNLRIEVLRPGGEVKSVQKSVVKCDKVQNCVTI